MLVHVTGVFTVLVSKDLANYFSQLGYLSVFHNASVHLSSLCISCPEKSLHSWLAQWNAFLPCLKSYCHHPQLCFPAPGVLRSKTLPLCFESNTLHHPSPCCYPSYYDGLGVHGDALHLYVPFYWLIFEAQGLECHELLTCRVTSLLLMARTSSHRAELHLTQWCQTLSYGACLVFLEVAFCMILCCLADLVALKRIYHFTAERLLLKLGS